MHMLDRAGARDLIVSPSPVAMVWTAPGRPHEAIAAPGVTLGRGDALVEVELATICGSDVHTVRGDRPASTPLVLGHEAVGRVVATGEGAIRADGTPLHVGERVVWSVAVSCGVCDRCLRGLPQKCRTLHKYGHEPVARGWELNGAFATHVQLKAGTAIVPVDDALPAFVAAPASCATATAVAALAAAEREVPLDGATVLVTGAGMLGLSVTALAAERGATVVVSDPLAARRGDALRFGAAAVADPTAGRASQGSLSAALAAVRRQGAGELLVAVEASGVAAAVRTAIGALEVGGVAVLVGSVFPGPDVPIAPEAIVRRLLTVRGVHNYEPGHLVDAVAALGRLWRTRPFEELVGAVHSLSDLDAALDRAASGAHVRVGVMARRRIGEQGSRRAGAQASMSSTPGVQD